MKNINLKRTSAQEPTNICDATYISQCVSGCMLIYKLPFDKHKTPPTEWRVQHKSQNTFWKQCEIKNEFVTQQDEYTDSDDINKDLMRYKRFIERIHRLYEQK